MSALLTSGAADYSSLIHGTSDLFIHLADAARSIAKQHLTRPLCRRPRWLLAVGYLTLDVWNKWIIYVNEIVSLVNLYKPIDKSY